jgi:hypothetical protein
LLHGPLVLFAMADSRPSFTENGLLQAKPVNNAQGDWTAVSAEGSSITMRPFMNLNHQDYSAYVQLKS